MARPRVLYVTGWLRSGSTMLGNVLGELPGVLHAGELHYLWRNGVLEARNQLALRLRRASDGLRAVVARARRRGRRRRRRDGAGAGRLAAHPSHAGPPGRAARRGLSGPGPEEAAIGRSIAVYRTLAELGGERLIVDSSKFPAEAAALLGRDDVDVRVLHIVRDPRATGVLLPAGQGLHRRHGRGHRAAPTGPPSTRHPRPSAGRPAIATCG